MNDRQGHTLFTFAGLIFLLSLVYLLTTRSADSQSAMACSAPFLIDVQLENGSRWEMCWEARAKEGIVYHDIYYTTPIGYRRKVLGQASLAQLHVPYDEYSMGRFYDVTDQGLGGANQQTLEAGECHDGTLLSDGTKNMICQQVEHHGYAHRFLNGDYKMATNLNLFSVSRVQRYVYIVGWEFNDDGSISPSVGAAGKLQQYKYVKEVDDTGYPHGWEIYEIQWGGEPTNVYGVGHAHNYWWRLDFDLDGDENDVVEEFNVYPLPSSSYRTISTTQILSETGRTVSPETFRSWRVKDTVVTNGDGHPISYELIPSAGGVFRGPSFEPWTQNDLYVTTYKSCEQFAAGNPTTGGCTSDVSKFINGESVDGSADTVVWYGASFHHTPRDEDDTMMPVHSEGFHIVPRDWTTENPNYGNVPTTVTHTAKKERFNYSQWTLFAGTLLFLVGTVAARTMIGRKNHW